MTFASFNFLLFFPLVVILFNLIPQRGKVWFLLVASYFFYINLQPVYALLLALVTGSTYLFTKGIYETKSDIKKHKLLIWGIIVVILPLFFFKYFGFINNSIFELLNHLWVTSFFTKNFIYLTHRYILLYFYGNWLFGRCLQ